MSKPARIAFEESINGVWEPLEQGREFKLAKRVKLRVQLTGQAGAGRKAVRVYCFVRLDGIPYQFQLAEDRNLAAGQGPHPLEFDFTPASGTRQTIKAIAWDMNGAGPSDARMNAAHRISVTGSKSRQKKKLKKEKKEKRE